MSDLMPDASAHVMTGNGWETAMYELAFLFWCSHGHNGSRVAFLLERHAIAQTPEGAEVPPVPSVSTINGWAKEHRWEQREWKQLSEDLPARVLRLQIAKLTLAEQAIETLHDVNAGRFDDLDPRIASNKSKTAIETLKMVGLGTFGANQGGLSVVQPQELLLALGEQMEQQPVSAKEKSRQLREQISGSKRGE